MKVFCTYASAAIKSFYNVLCISDSIASSYSDYFNNNTVSTLDDIH